MIINSNIRYVGLLGHKAFSFLDNENVLDIKTSEETSLDYIEKEFEFRVIRFSKYDRGIEAIYNIDIHNPKDFSFLFSFLFRNIIQPINLKISFL